jgi:DNA polymerase I-like protein with 3'-5' exonuclease and polymerase domains
MPNTNSVSPEAAEILEDLIGGPLEVGEYKADCPAHASVSGQSLGVTITEDKVLLNCFAGCPTVSVLEELDLTWSDLYFSPHATNGHPKKPRKKADFSGAVAVYEYTTAAGDPVSRSVRFPDKNGKKVVRQATYQDGEWWWGKPEDFKPVPYNLPAVYRAVLEGEPVYIFEGEPDVEAAAEWGLVGTTNPEGAGKFYSDLTPYFRGANVIVVPDDDGPGAAHAEDVARKLHGTARSIKVLPPLPNPNNKLGWDFRDWKNAGGTPDRLRGIVDLCVNSQFPFPKYGVGSGNECVVQLSKYPRPRGSQPFLIEGVVPEAFPTVFYGDSGTLKTTLAAHLALSVAAGKDAWLGFTIKKQVPVLYIDFELDLPTMLRKLYDLAAGVGLDGLPDGTHYISGAGRTTKDTFSEALRFAENNGVGLVVVDSLGIAMDGDMDGAKTVVQFMHEVMDKFRSRGVTSVLVDHQGKLQMGEHYQSKTQYGNSFKKHLVRSQFQVEGKDGGLTIRHKKTNFGPLLDPFGATVEFEHEKITVERTELTQAELAEEATVSIRKRILIALEDGPAFTDALAERLNAEHKTVSNRVSDLVKSEKVEYTGREENRFREVRLKRLEKSETCTNSQTTTNPKGMGIGNEETPDRNGEKSDPTNPIPNVGNGAGNGRINRFSLVTDEAGAEDTIAWLKTVPSVALDIETYGKNKDGATSYLKGTVRLVTFHHGDTTKVVDLHAVSDEIAARMLGAVEDKPKYLHNAMFDLPRLYRRTGVLLKDRVYDTMIASRAARAGETERSGAQKSHELGPVLERELGVTVDKEIDHKWGEPLTPERLEYAVNDVLHLEELHKALERLLDRHNVKDRYEAVRATLPTFLEAAVRGVPLDRGSLEELNLSALAERDRLRKILDNMAPEHPEKDEGEAWTWNTNANGGPGSRGRNGARRALEVVGVKVDNLEDRTLLDHRDDHPLVAALQDYRKKAQEYSKYRKWIPDFCEDGRIYPQPKVAGAVTSRLLYSSPNIQGVEKHKTTEYRKVIRPTAGMSIVTGDFAQQEHRIAALVSGDKALLETFVRGDDVYLKTASKMMGYEITDKEHPARAGAKRATLGFLYGLGLAKYRENTYKDYGIALSEKQAKKDRDAFRAAFPEFYAWQQEYGSRNDRETRSILGWRRVVGLGRDRDGKTVPKYTDRLNGPIQSTAGDILYLALAKMQEDWAAGIHPDAKFLMGVHDEIVLEAPEESAKDVALWLQEKMREAFEEVLGPKLGGPKSVDVGYGPSWGEQHDVETPKDKE